MLPCASGAISFLMFQPGYSYGQWLTRQERRAARNCLCAAAVAIGLDRGGACCI